MNLTIEDFKVAANENNYQEEKAIDSSVVLLKEFLSYEELSMELKIYLCEFIIVRHFPPTGGVFLPDDVNWFIESYFDSYKKDLIEPTRTNTIIEAKKMILSDDHFGKATIATLFMFALIEFCAKSKLGFEPFKYDFFDTEKNSYSKKFSKTSKAENIFIGRAIELLEEQAFPISFSLQKINKDTAEWMQEVFIDERRFIFFRISKRLTIARNAMMHGENLSFPANGKYLLMLYILFQLNETI